MLAPGGRVQTHVQGQPFLLLSVERLVEGEALISNFTGSFGETEKLFEILENWNDQLSKVKPKLEIVEPLASASNAVSRMRP